MPKKLKCNVLSISSIDNLINEIEAYQNSLSDKCVEVCKALSDIGIRTAREHTGTLDDLGNVSYLVNFSMEIKDVDKYKCKAVMFGADIMDIVQSWQDKDGNIKSANVSPLLMYEFGSGQKAENPKNIQGYGQGTFPNQTHAFDANGWSWKGLDGQWHHSKGITPTMPMFNAWIEMYLNVVNTVITVFRS